MSERFHLNPETGNAGACEARPGHCRFGGDGEHFDTPADARKAYEKVMSGSAWPSPKPVRKHETELRAPRDIQVEDKVYIELEDEGPVLIVVEESDGDSFAGKTLDGSWTLGNFSSDRTAYEVVVGDLDQDPKLQAPEIAELETAQAAFSAAQSVGDRLGMLRIKRTMDELQHSQALRGASLDEAVSDYPKEELPPLLTVVDEELALFKSRDEEQKEDQAGRRGQYATYAADKLMERNAIARALGQPEEEGPTYAEALAEVDEHNRALQAKLRETVASNANMMDRLYNATEGLADETAQMFRDNLKNLRSVNRLLPLDDRGVADKEVDWREAEVSVWEAEVACRLHERRKPLLMGRGEWEEKELAMRDALKAYRAEARRRKLDWESSQRAAQV